MPLPNFDLLSEAKSSVKFPSKADREAYGMQTGHKFRMGISAGAAMLAVTAAWPVSAADPPDWSAPVKPFHIAGPVYYVGTKGLAAYLIRSRHGAILAPSPEMPRRSSITSRASGCRSARSGC